MRAAQDPSGRKEGASPPGEFVTTHWSMVLAAGETASPQSAAALEKLCEAYWYPLYAYVRRSGHNPDDAKDLTQEFFARLLERKYLRLADPDRGRFRSFLLTSLKHFLINEWKRANREKRGAGQTFIALDEDLAESRFAAESAENQPPETRYDRAWAGMLMERALIALRGEFDQGGKRELFERLKVFVWGDKNTLSYAAMAEQLGMTEGAVKVAVHRVRKRYRTLLRQKIGETVVDPADIGDEIRFLISALR